MKRRMTDDELETIVGKPQFHNTVFYAYNARLHSFFFYTPVQGRELVPIGVFSPMMREDIPYDPQELVEGIADIMSRSTASYDFELDDDDAEDA